MYFFFFKQKTAYEMRISDWSSDVCSSDLDQTCWTPSSVARSAVTVSTCAPCCRNSCAAASISGSFAAMIRSYPSPAQHFASSRPIPVDAPVRSEEHTSELQSLMRISYAVFCLKKTTNHQQKARRKNKGHR